jgi:ectoine hydroxylase-related dioxygenase (phytanoyl-CoA dioxygenase family)
MNVFSTFSEKNFIELDENGFTVMKNFINKEIINGAKQELIDAFKDGHHPHHIIASSSSLHVHNFFLYGKQLRALLFGEKMQQLHLSCFDSSYSLRNAVASSIQINEGVVDSSIHKPIGSDWHRDTPQFLNRKGNYVTLSEGTTFQVIIAIDATNITNSTKVFVGSHKDPLKGHKLNEQQIEDFSSRYQLQDVILESGDVAIIDDNIFHKAGLATKDSRWLLFCSFTPWFIKPYFDYTQIQLDAMTSYEAHCLHQTSKPPMYNEQLRNTYISNNWGGTK